MFGGNRKKFDTCQVKTVKVEGPAPYQIPTSTKEKFRTVTSFEASLSCPGFGQESLKTNLSESGDGFSQESYARDRLRSLAARTCGSCVFATMSKVDYLNTRAGEIEAGNRLKQATLDQQAIDAEIKKALGAATGEIDAINVAHLGSEAQPTPPPPQPEE